MSSALAVPVRWFIDDVAQALADVKGSGATVDDDTRADVTVEAFNLTAAFIDADGLHTDDELWALVAAFGPLLDTQLAGATPADVRKAGLVAGKRDTLSAPSQLFELLADADARNGTRHSHGYYQGALDIAFAVAATDAHTSETELHTIESFQRLLLERMNRTQVPQPSAPKPKPQPQTAEGPPPSAPAESIDALLAELDALVGLSEVKREIRLTADLARVEQIRRQRKLPVLDRSRHLVFTGNPGTGKTTVARLLARIYRTLGVVRQGQLVETDRSQLVAGYVGQTAIQVRDAFDRADGGVLLIDEAYALTRGGASDFGREAIDTVVKLVEDRRASIIVIVAGYPEEMATFVDSNPGLRSRFPKTIHFPDYSTDELVQIFDDLASAQRYQLDAEAAARVRAWFDAQPRVKGFGNGRLARNLFEACVARQAGRLADVTEPTDADLCTMTTADVPGETDAA